MIHPRGEATFAVSGHRARGHGRDRGVMTSHFLGLPDAVRGFKAVHLRHLHVHDDQIECFAGVGFQGLASIDGVYKRVAALFQDDGGDGTIDDIVLSQQDV